MKKESIERLDQIFTSSATQLFEAYGVSLGVQGLGEPSAMRSIAVSIGFTGSVFRGVLGIIVDASLVAATVPEGLRQSLQPQILADWAGELANQLLGRMHNKLLTVGIDILISTPTVLFGDTMHRQNVSAAGLVLQRHFCNPNGHCAVTLAVEYPEGFELSDVASAIANVMSEGDLELF